MKNNPFTGTSCAIAGLRLIFRPGIRIFLFAPLFVNILIFGTMIWVGTDQFGNLLDRLLPENGWLSYLRWLLWPLLGIALLLAVVSTFTVIANLIAAPFNGLLSEKVEEFLVGRTPEQTFGWKDILKDVLPSVLSELRKLLYFVLRAIPLLLLFLIPGINFLAPFLWFLFSAWYLALEYADYPMANNGLKFKRQLNVLRQARLSSLGFGTGVAVLTMIPILNFVAMPAGVAGATLFWHRQLRERALDPQTLPRNRPIRRTPSAS